MSTEARKVLSVQDLCVRFQLPNDACFDAVQRVSFELKAGQTLALVGESGSGKSVTAKSILRLLAYPQAQHPAGQIVFDEEDLLEKNEDAMRTIRGARIGMIFQEPMTSLNPLHTVERQIAEAVQLHHPVQGRALRQRVLELLNKVQIPEPEKRLASFPHQLSGGQRQRVMIAMALANDPEILIADEPTTALDVTVQAEILALLAELQQRQGMAILLITHDLNIVRHVADEVCVMQAGLIVESGRCQQVFSHPNHPYTQKLLAAEPSGKPTPVPSQAKPLLEAKDIRVWFPIKKGLLRRTVDHVKAVDGVSIDLKEGETLGVVGESGSGKSTLAMALLHLQAFEGQVVFLGRALHSLKRPQVKALRRDLQVVFQDPYESLSPRMSGAQIVSEGLLAHPDAQSGIGIEQQVIHILEQVGLDPDIRHRYPHEFSGGQRQRLAVARAMILKPKLVILDEPTSALDRSIQIQIMDLLRSLQNEQRLAYIFISHDLAVVRAMSHRVVIMRHGRVVESGDTEAVYQDPQTLYTQRLIQAATQVVHSPTAYTQD